MTITTYYAAHKLGRANGEADALIHLVNDTTAGSGDNRCWDATRAHIDALVDSDTQRRLGIVIEAEQFDLASDDL